MENPILDYQPEPNERILVPASKGKRFANYLIDYVCIVLVAVLIFVFMMSSPGMIDENSMIVNLMF
ncbi:MAG: hypothetical protein AAB316_02015 [Bacteroidota bacterium]